MNTNEIKEILATVISGTVGIYNFHPISFDDKASETDNWLDLVQIEETSDGIVIKLCISILGDVSAKFIITQIHKQLLFQLKERKFNLSKLIVFIKGVIYE
ncbi:hypothetical protein ACJA23_03305 [Mycoplasma corogypsi]|uniref:hypothetical protein n=1 Tax=Mycoplasma corogypsi TaxID=2106 RepID=UPI003873B75D